MGDVDQSEFVKLFRRFGPVQSVFLFVGVVMVHLGLVGGFHLTNRTMMVGVALMCSGIAGHYCSNRRYDNLFTGDRFVRVRWVPMLLGVIFAVVAVASAYFAYTSK